MVRYCLILLFILQSCVSTQEINRSVSQDTQCSKSNVQACYENNQISFVRNKEEVKTVDELRRGPKFDPQLTDVELKESTVFCRYYYHEFSSEGSAKFMCAKTNSLGELYDEGGEIIKAAKSVATEKMNLRVKLNGQDVVVEEGVLLGDDGLPLIEKKTSKSGKIKEKFIEGDLIKVKYFIDEDQTKGHVKRQNVEIESQGINVQLSNVFVGPSELSNLRWTEIFTEVASTRLFWTLGFPADRTQPLKKVVCFGCNQHPKEQTDYDKNLVSIFQTVSLEKKYKAKKLNDTASVEAMTQAYLNNKWSEQSKVEFEELILMSRLVGYSNAAESQNRLVCDKDSYDTETKACTQPIAVIQDLGGSWAWRLDGFFDKAFGMIKFKGKPRGDYERYSKNNIFKSGCELTFPFGKTDSKSEFQLSRISEAGRLALLRRLDQLTDQHIYSLFEVARFGDIEPEFRDKQKGKTIDEKRSQVIHLWANALKDKISEIRNARCN